MLQKEATIQNIHGIHVRPSTLIASKLAQFEDTEILLKKKSDDAETDGSWLSMKSSLDLLLGALQNQDSVIIQTEGKYAQEAMLLALELIEHHFDFESPSSPH